MPALSACNADWFIEAGDATGIANRLPRSVLVMNETIEVGRTTQDVRRLVYYTRRMIRSYRDRVAENLAKGEQVRKFSAIAKQAAIRLAVLDSAESLWDLSMPGYRLEKLLGDRKGQYSIRINDQYRICFEWREDGAYNVEVVDYH